MEVVKWNDSTTEWFIIFPDGDYRRLGNRPEMIRDIQQMIESLPTGGFVSVKYCDSIRKLTILEDAELGSFVFQMPNFTMYNVKLEKLRYTAGIDNDDVVGYYEPLF